jgi:S-DNA-T family DNA segregation ATPase FtsK/SpoIIIE
MKNKTKEPKTRHLNNRQAEVLGLILIVLSVLFAMSLASYSERDELLMNHHGLIDNSMGIAGVFISHFLIKLGVGYFAWGLIPLLFVWGVCTLFRLDKTLLKRVTGFSIALILLLSILFSIDTMPENTRQFPVFAGSIAYLLSDWLGVVPAIIALITTVLILISGFFRFSLSAPIRSLKEGRRIGKEERVKPPKKKLFSLFRKKNRIKTPEPFPAQSIPQEQPFPPVPPVPRENNINDENIPVKPVINTTKKAKTSVPESKTVYQSKPYVLPGADLLTKAPENTGYDEKELRDKADLLTRALAEFNVDARVVKIIPGPVITMYELELGRGVRVNKIVHLEDDIARIMAAKHVRIIAPIPGKTVVGVEIPNRIPELIHYHSIVNSNAFRSAQSLLTIAVGKTTEGIPFTFDLDKMPHLLVAGTTGSGKSVCINTIIMSILYRATPEEVKFILVDPKMIELSIYKALEPYHLITSEDLDEYVITNAQNAIYALRSAVIEMDSRYVKMLDASVRNIGEYNEKMKKAGKPVMPYIIVVIDELADLMSSTLGKGEIELPIQRLAQKSRAVGIHLVVATQRPSVDVITGVIRANFPARVAFAVASKTDSRTILDINGAEQLLGRGDMLYLPPGRSEPIRLHNAYISLEEIENVLEHINRQPRRDDDYCLPTAVEAETDEDMNGFTRNGSRDPLFNDAMKQVIIHQQGSASLLQRRLKVGYSRAGRLIDELEEAGIVGPSIGSKAREVLVGPEYLEHIASIKNGSFDEE